MPEAKHKIPRRSAKRLPPPDEAPTGRNAVNYILTDAEHARVLAEVRQLAELNGLPALSVGKYGKHALLSYNRLRKIESQVRSMLTWIRKDLPAARHPYLKIAIIEQLRSILETPAAGV